jgi:hypothetical protein
VSDPATLKNHIWVMRSPDGGRTFRDPVAAATSVVYGNRGDELKMLKSLAGARITMDTSAASAFRGRLYLSYLTVLDRRLQVVVTASRDSGQTWSAPVRVNDERRDRKSQQPADCGERPGRCRASSGTTVALIREIFASARRLASRWTAGRRSSRACRSRQRRRVRWVRTPRPRSSWTGSQAATCRGGETQGLAALPGRRFLAVFVGGGATMQLRSAVIEIVPDRDQR